MQKKLVVIGGGAAGFFCAINAARLNPGLEVMLLEKTSKLLSKVRVSGGGRCNVTHACFDIAEMSKRYPRGQHFVKKAFHQFFTTDTIEWFGERGVELKTEEDGRMFPVSNSSETIISCLLSEASRYRIDIRMNETVEAIRNENGQFIVLSSRSGDIRTDMVCVATGGFPKAAMFDWLKLSGHSISNPVPSLFTFNLPKNPITQLMGISVEQVKLKIEGSKLKSEGPLLITHWGLSGPAVLKLSAWGAIEFFEKNYSFKVHVNWIPEKSEEQIRAILKQSRNTEAAKKISSNNFTPLPKRLYEFLLLQSGIAETLRFADLSSKHENNLVRNLVDFVVPVSGKTTFKEEFVTAGGIKLGEVDPNTMMSRKIPGLYFAGEVLDVDGITGGYNFQHAWTSGFVAAMAISNSQ